MGEYTERHRCEDYAWSDPLVNRFLRYRILKLRLLKLSRTKAISEFHGMVSLKRHISVDPW